MRRVTVEEGRLAFRIPAIALERAKDGTVTIQISINNPDRRYTAVLPAVVWDHLSAEDAAARGPQPKQPPLPKDKPPPFCHGWSINLEAADAGKSWSQAVSTCSVLENGPAFTYAYELARLAIDNIEACAAAKAETEAKTADSPERPIWALIACGGRFAPRMLE